MKQKQLSKYALLGILAFSLFSALYVNLDAAEAARAQAPNAHNKAELVLAEEEKQERNLPIPDVTLIGRIVDLAQRLVSSVP